MKKSTPKQAGLSLVFSPEAAHEQLIEQARCAALSFATELINQEVTNLCGERFSHKKGIKCYRGGSQGGYVQMQGGKYRVSRPRVRSKDGEVCLTSYEALKDGDLLDENMLGKMIGGVSTRKYEGIIDGYAERYNVSKSSVSRSFVKASKKHLEELNGSNLSGHSFVALMLDGIEIAGKVLVAALGFTANGEKITLGIREGSTENSEVVKDLLLGIMDRGFTQAANKILVCVDGGKALHKAVKEVLGDAAVISRCYLHKLRNLEAYVPKDYHPHLRRKMKKLTGLVNYDEALEELYSLVEWLSGISSTAVSSIEEAADELIVLQKLGMPAKLRKTFSTTNAIESLFSTVRPQINRVKKWNTGTDQRARWVATAIRSNEKRKKKLHGYKQIPLLIEALNQVDDKKHMSYKRCVSSPS